MKNVQIGGAQFAREKYNWKQTEHAFGRTKQVIVLSRPRCSKHMQHLRAFVQT